MQVHRRFSDEASSSFQPTNGTYFSVVYYAHKCLTFFGLPQGITRIRAISIAIHEILVVTRFFGVQKIMFHDVVLKWLHKQCIAPLRLVLAFFV